MVGHHPPSRSDSIYLWGREYTQLVQEYHNVIILQVFGHTHSDHFQVVSKHNKIIFLGTLGNSLYSSPIYSLISYSAKMQPQSLLQIGI